MSIRTTPTGSAGTQPTGGAAAQDRAVPQEKIAMRAYEKWCQRGCPQGTHEQDWPEPEQELRQEMSQAAPSPKPQAQVQAQPMRSAQPMPRR